MVANRKSIQDYLKEFNFEELFVDELRWNRLRKTEPQEPQILCSLGLFEATGGA